MFHNWFILFCFHFINLSIHWSKLMKPPHYLQTFYFADFTNILKIAEKKTKVFVLVYFKTFIFEERIFIKLVIEWKQPLVHQSTEFWLLIAGNLRLTCCYSMHANNIKVLFNVVYASGSLNGRLILRPISFKQWKVELSFCIQQHQAIGFRVWVKLRKPGRRKW